MRKILALIAASCLALSLVGCSTNSEDSSSSTSNEPTAEVAIENIEWSVDATRIDGQKVIALDYTNNSPYTIFGFKMEFQQREDVTDEQRDVFDEVYEDNESWESMQGGPEELYVTAESVSISDPGEASTMPCTFNGTATLVDTMDQYELMEPTIATIMYIKDGKGYAEYYDFEQNEYTMQSGSGKDAVNWSDSDTAKLVPKLEGQVVVVTSDSESAFSAQALGKTHDDYKYYVDACKELGYTEDLYSSDSYYSASDTDGNSLTVNYNERQEYLSVSVYAA